MVELERLRTRVAPDSTALVIIDMQRDYCCEGGIFDRMGFDLGPPQELAARLRDFVGKAREALKFIVHVRMTPLAQLNSRARLEQFARNPLMRRREAAYSEFYGVVPAAGDMIVDKYRYSAFVSTILDTYLRANEITTLVLTGLATNVCLESTARDAFMREYTVIVPRDMTEGTSQEAKKWSLYNLDTFFAEVVDSTDLLACWGLA